MEIIDTHLYNVKTHPLNYQALQAWLFPTRPVILSSLEQEQKALVQLATIDYFIKFRYNDEVFVRDISGRDGKGFINVRTLFGRQNRFPADTKVEVLCNLSETNYLDGFAQYAVKINVDDTLQRYKEILTGRIEWLTNQYMTYSSGPSNPVMSESDYLEMCCYFGFARREKQKCIVWYKDDIELLAPYLET